MEPINISNHPETPEIRRKATYQSFEIDQEKRQIVLIIVVSHYKAIPIPDTDSFSLQKTTTFRDIYPRLVVDETTFVNQQGEIDPNSSISEWDFFQALGEIPIVVNQIIRNKILWADSLGRLNIGY